ncbi:Glyoxalase/Bleomycin resistance protein/Dioxygenase superfamily protein [Hydrocarboniphaga daqingensis]|uniref:Glyoxalase/Bleomycin resistance protein/Dioxygenase superfamily protein n=1 Tax=Hydrocarboniphaga daqingensis TaxID=490188 RepID=A0A1M5P5P8_9GAMM|nr:Glyoxalase/Bleomycin resistance protein/Dioxygenase superfamily protein [Hydrocarboniphaga daqingensis]
MTELRTAQPARHPHPTVRASSLAYLIFERPNLDEAEHFLTDFGLVPTKRTDDVLYLRAAASAPYCYRVHRAKQARFVGMGFAISRRADLEKLATLPGVSAIEAAPHPGGGDRVVLTDPSGFRVEAIQGQTPAEELLHRRPLPFNSAGASLRINETQRPAPKPPDVIRLGHVVIEVADYQATSAWYTQHLGLIPSDVQVLPDGSPAVTFFRLDLGDTPTDHHSLAMAQGFMPRYSHSAFEVVDADAVGMGQRVLREMGWQHAWGMGRHILGSQIFDYWNDPWGAKHEHYCDGDLFTSDRPMGVHAVSRSAMAQWGQPMPASFTKPKFTLRAIAALINNLRHSPDLSISKLITLAKLFG